MNKYNTNSKNMVGNCLSLFLYKLGACRRLPFAYWPILHSRCAYTCLYIHSVLAYTWCVRIGTACCVYNLASIFVGTKLIRDVLRQKRATLDTGKFDHVIGRKLRPSFPSLLLEKYTMPIYRKDGYRIFW